MLTPFHWLTQLLVRLVSFFELVFLPLTPPFRYSIVLSTATDLTHSQADLIAENALLRQQLIVLHRQVKKPAFSQADRLWLVLLASRVKNWKDTLLTFKPDTLLRWQRQGFHLFWKFKSRNRGGRPKLSTETVALIQQMAQEHRLWGPKGFAGNGSNSASRPVDKLRTALRVLRLAETYTPARLEAACARGVAFGDASLGTLKRILVEHLDELVLPALPQPNREAFVFARPTEELVQAIGGGVTWN